MKKNVVEPHPIKPVKILIILTILALAAGCLPLRPAATKSGKRLYETFFVGEEGTLYFIKPLTLVSTDKQQKMDMDFTFRYRNEIKGNATVNVSLIGSQMNKSVSSLIISNKLATVEGKEIRFLFSEKKGDLYVFRYSLHLPLSDVCKLFESADWSVTVHNEHQHTIYLPSNKTKKAISALQNQLFDIVQ